MVYSEQKLTHRMKERKKKYTGVSYCVYTGKISGKEMLDGRPNFSSSIPEQGSKENSKSKKVSTPSKFYNW